MLENPRVLLSEGVLDRFFKALESVNMGCQFRANFPEVVVGGEV